MNFMTKNILAAITAATLSLPTTAAADDISYETLICFITKEVISITVPMPMTWDKKKKETESHKICDSITNRIQNNTGAVCDTDYNCEVLYDQYKQYGIAEVTVAEDRLYVADGFVVEVKCADGRTKYANGGIPQELQFTCSDPQKTYEKMAWGEEKEFDTLDWKELQTFLDKESKERLQNTSNEAPSLTVIKDVLKKHPETVAMGTYYKEYGLIIDELWVRFGNPDYVEQWFLDICTGADERPGDNPKNIPGWRCWWD